jgi:hypothetical protein
MLWMQHETKNPSCNVYRPSFVGINCIEKDTNKQTKIRCPLDIDVLSVTNSVMLILLNFCFMNLGANFLVNCIAPMALDNAVA